MIRRKIWATATCCLAFAGAATAQTGAAPKAKLGAPQPSEPGYVARGAEPNPGYPSFIPRGYVAPTPPTYKAPVAPPTLPAPTSATPPKLMPISSAAPATLGTVPLVLDHSVFAADMVPTTPMPATSTPGAPSPNGAAPAAPVTTAPVAGMPMPAGTPMPCGPNGCAPYLDSSCAPMPTCWVSFEYLKWQMKGVTLFPLVSAAPAGAPGTVDDAATTVLYGGPDVLKDWQSGFRLRGGMWFEDGTSGLDFAFFTLGQAEDSFAASSSGNPGLFRPFFNTSINAEDAQLVAFIDPVAGPVLAGAVAVRNQSELMGFELNYRTGWSSGMEGMGGMGCMNGMGGMNGRIDALCGYRYLRLKDTIDIQSSLTTRAAAGAAPAGTRIFSGDQFETLNQFNGLQVGLVGEWQLGQMTFGLRGTVAAGVTTQRVEINGASGSVTPAGVAVIAPGGLLALPTNMGEYERNRFSIAPELGVTVGYQVMDNVRVFAGYNVLWWSNVVRAGEQMNRFVNANFIPDPTTGVAPRTGSPSPLFRFRDESFFAHGCMLGVEFRW